MPKLMRPVAMTFVQPASFNAYSLATLENEAVEPTRITAERKRFTGVRDLYNADLSAFPVALPTGRLNDTATATNEVPNCGCYGMEPRGTPRCELGTTLKSAEFYSCIGALSKN